MPNNITNPTINVTYPIIDVTNLTFHVTYPTFDVTYLAFNVTNPTLDVKDLIFNIIKLILDDAKQVDTTVATIKARPDTQHQHFLSKHGH